MTVPKVDRAYLVVKSGGKPRRVITLKAAEFSIGRQRTCDLTLHDQTISRDHARIRYHDGTFYLQDQGSRRGKFVNGQQVEAVPLKEGDQLRLGTVELAFSRQPVPVSRSWHMLPGAVAAAAFLVIALAIIVSQTGENSTGGLPAVGTPTLFFASEPRLIEQQEALQALELVSLNSPEVRLRGDMVRFLTARVPAGPGDPETQARNFLDTYHGLYGLTDSHAELTLLQTRTDSLGWQDVLFEQRINRVLVHGGQIRVHISPDGTITSVNGIFVPDTDTLNLTPTLTANEAVERVRSVVDTPDDSRLLSPPGLQIYAPLVYGETSSNPMLVWQMVMNVAGTDGEIEAQEILVDAHNGDLIRTASRTYLFQPGTIGGVQVADGSLLCHPGADRAANEVTAGVDPEPAAVHIYDLHNQPVSNYVQNSNWWPCRTGLGTEVLPSANQNDAEELRQWTKDLYTYWHDSFDRLSYDDSNSPMIVHTNYVGLHNASDADNAAWVNECRVVYVSRPAVCDDVVRHEWTHGMIHCSVIGGLGGSVFAQALNESLADTFAYFMDTDPYMGEKCNLNGNPMRSMREPQKYNQGVHAVWPNDTADLISRTACSFGLDANCVHTLMGIPNKAAYLLVEGGTHYGVTVEGIGRAKAQQIYYRAITAFLTPTADFYDARLALHTACRELAGVDAYGITPHDCQQVERSWEAVGIVWRTGQLPNASQATLRPLPVVTPILEVGGTQVGTGDVQITLIWNTPADVDLHVRDPRGEHIYFVNERSASGGWLDVDIIPDCDDSAQHVENIYWERGAAPTGDYEAWVELYNQGCSTLPVPVHVVVYLDGQAHEFALEVSHEWRKVDVMEFAR